MIIEKHIKAPNLTQQPAYVALDLGFSPFLSTFLNLLNNIKNPINSQLLLTGHRTMISLNTSHIRLPPTLPLHSINPILLKARQDNLIILTKQKRSRDILVPSIGQLIHKTGCRMGRHFADPSFAFCEGDVGESEFGGSGDVCCVCPPVCL